MTDHVIQKVEPLDSFGLGQIIGGVEHSDINCSLDKMLVMEVECHQF